MTRYCMTCNCFVPSHVEIRDETLLVLNREEITVRGNIRICDVCGESLFDEKLDNALLIAAYEEYNRRHPDDQIIIRR